MIRDRGKDNRDGRALGHGSGEVVEISSVSAPARVDGRTARAIRTQQAIVDALLEMHVDGDLRPTGERIAERAGVSLRALWANFKDMETLYAAAGERLIELQRASYRQIPADLPLPLRVEAFCTQRARMLEILAPAARAAQLREPFSAQLQRNRAKQYARARKEIDILFGAELSAAGDSREQLRDALLAATTWPAWSVLRDLLELDVDAACGVMTRTVTSLLAAALTSSLS
jgi:TetR/AcrR family transcriptional regulator of autoinduction and epiphytic fitness